MELNDSHMKVYVNHVRDRISGPLLQTDLRTIKDAWVDYLIRT